MRRWALAFIVLAAVVLAMLLVGSPDTGGDIAPRRSAPVASADPIEPPEITDPDADEAPPEEPIRVEKPELPEGERMFREDGTPLPPAATPEGEMAARVHPLWSGVVQTMSDQANSHPQATNFETQAVMIQREIDGFVRGEGGDIAAIERMQRQLIDELRQSDLYDEEMQRTLDEVERELERWHQQREGIAPVQ
jgi:hypothetical protein